MPLREAAELLGVSKDAVRQRIRRGTLRSEKEEDGRVYVYLDAATDASTHGVHGTANTGEAPDRTEQLIATLREQLQAERQAHAEARRLLAAALERIPPQLPSAEPPQEAPTAPRGSPTSAEVGEDNTYVPPPQQGPTSRRTWWQRWFGA